MLLGAEGLHRLAEVGEHEQQSRGAILGRLVKQDQLVLAEHTLGEESDDDPDLGREHEPHPDLHGGAQWA